MTPDFDFNHDGKVDMQDVHLYEDIFSEESKNNAPSGSSTGGHMSGRAISGRFCRQHISEHFCKARSESISLRLFSA